MTMRGQRAGAGAFPGDSVPVQSQGEDRVVWPRCLLWGLVSLLLWLSLPVMAATAFSVQHQGVEYDVYRLDPGEEQGLHFYWKRPDGSPYASLQALRQELAARGEGLTFAVNGGIYSRDLAPLGLYIEDGTTLIPLNRGRGGGNFFLKPNGVFYVTAQGAGVVQTDEYRPPAPVRYAVQSGPMLVIDGALHPRFIPGYESRYVRNGVGVDRAGRVVFAISDGETNFHDFGTLFRDRLDCPNALYLDGQISQMYLPPLNHYAFWAWRPLVAIIAVTQPAGPTTEP
ncbi:MAG: hypothetical protein EOM92_15365 [Gammaproteobacteria bacterium]|nr:hypothetical protein [Gammaproteobacteria bacterium]